MKLQHIDLNDLKTTRLNVRKKGARDIADILPSIRAQGLLQPLLVRPNCEGFEIIAGQRRFHALQVLAEETEGELEPVPCLVMDEGDDAKAVEASLAENLARLPMDEIDQYKAFAALVKQGRSVDDIAAHFGITERLVTQRLAIANLIAPILKAYQLDDIHPATLRILTMATKAQQKAWWALYGSEDQHAPVGHRLKDWLFGGEQILTTAAIFDLSDYDGALISDLFGDDVYFDDPAKFWALQNAAIAALRQSYLDGDWQEVTVLEIGEHWASWEHVDMAKEDGGKVFICIDRNGEVTAHEGQLSRKEAERRLKAENGEDAAAPKPEITKVMQNYLELHRHAAVRVSLLEHRDIALRLAVAQIVAGSELWDVTAEPQKAATEAIGQSVTESKAEQRFGEARQNVRDLLGMTKKTDDTLVYRKDDWGKSHDLHKVFTKLLSLDDDAVMQVLAFVVAETLPSGSAMVEALGKLLGTDMVAFWSSDETFLDLVRDKEVINAMLGEVAGKSVADGNLTATAKVQKQIIADCLNGKRKDAKQDWQSRYMRFPMGSYTKRGGIRAVDAWESVGKHYR